MLRDLENFDFFDFESRVTAGVGVHCRRLPRIWKNLVHVRILVRVGARHGKPAVAHALEHTSRRGTERYPNYRSIKELDFDLFLESLNAWTHYDFTCYQAATNPFDLPEAMSVLRDMVFRPLITPELTERERKVILLEHWETYDTPRRENVYRRYWREIYGDHPFAEFYEEDGWADAIQAVTAEDLLAFHAEHYHPSNMSLLFAGDLDMDEAMRAAEIFLPEVPRRDPITSAPPLRECRIPRRREYVISTRTWFGTMDVQKTNLEVCRIIPRHGKIQAVWLLKHILKEFAADIRGELDANYHVRVELGTYEDHHRFRFLASIGTEIVDDVRRMVEEFLAGFSGLKHYDRFQRARARMLKRPLDFNVETTADYGVSDLGAFGRIIPLSESRPAISKIEFEEVQEIARELSPEKLYWLVVKP